MSQGHRWTANERREGDFYPTPDGMTEDIVSYIADNYGKDYSRVLDIGAGHGVFGAAVRNIMNTDLLDGVESDPEFEHHSAYSNWINQDFNLWLNDNPYDLIIGNPPYVKNLPVWVNRARDMLAPKGIFCWLLRTEFMAGKRRQREIFSKWRPYEVVQIVGRVSFKYPETSASGNYDSAFYIWGKDTAPTTQLQWMPARNTWKFKGIQYEK